MSKLFGSMLVVLALLSQTSARYYGKEAYTHGSGGDKIVRGIYGAADGISRKIAAGDDKNAESLNAYITNTGGFSIDDFIDAFDDGKLDSTQARLVFGIIGPVAALAVMWLLYFFWSIGWCITQCCIAAICPQRQTSCCWQEPTGPKRGCVVCTKVSWLIIAIFLLFTWILATVQSFSLDAAIDSLSAVPESGFDLTGRMTSSLDTIQNIIETMKSTVSNVYAVTTSYLPLQTFEKIIDNITINIGKSKTNAASLQNSIDTFSGAIDPTIRDVTSTANGPFVRDTDPFKFHFESSGADLQCNTPVSHNDYLNSIQQFLERILVQSQTQYTESFNAIHSNTDNLRDDANNLKDGIINSLTDWNNRFLSLLENVVEINDFHPEPVFKDVTEALEGIANLTISFDGFLDDLHSTIYQDFQKFYKYLELAQMKLDCCGYYETETEVHSNKTQCGLLSAYVEENFCKDIDGDKDAEAICKAVRAGISGDARLFDLLDETDITSYPIYTALTEEATTALNGAITAIKEIGTSAVDTTKEIDEDFQEFSPDELESNLTTVINTMDKTKQDVINSLHYDPDQYLKFLKDINATLDSISKFFKLDVPNRPPSITGKNYFDVTPPNFNIRAILRLIGILFGVFFLINALILIARTICGVFFDKTGCFCCCTCYDFFFVLFFGFYLLTAAIVATIFLYSSSFVFDDDTKKLVAYDAAAGKAGPLLDALHHELPDYYLHDASFSIGKVDINLKEMVRFTIAEYGDTFTLLLDYSDSKSKDTTYNPLFRIVSDVWSRLCDQFGQLTDFNDVFGPDDKRSFTLKSYALELAWYTLDQTDIILKPEKYKQYTNNKSITDYFNVVKSDPYLKDLKVDNISPDATVMSSFNSIVNLMKDVASTDAFHVLFAIIDPIFIHIPDAIGFTFSCTLLFFIFFCPFIILSGCARTYWPPYPADAEENVGGNCCQRHCWPIKRLRHHIYVKETNLLDTNSDVYYRSYDAPAPEDHKLW